MLTHFSFGRRAGCRRSSLHTLWHLTRLVPARRILGGEHFNFEGRAQRLLHFGFLPHASTAQGLCCLWLCCVTW